jgi:hypothetical protein
VGTRFNEGAGPGRSLFSRRKTMNKAASTIGRRELLVRTAPACALTCLGLARAEGLAAAFSGPLCQEVHKFDRREERSLSPKETSELMARALHEMIRTLRREVGDSETIRMLKLNSDEIGRQRGVMHAERSPDTSFESFVSLFRQMASGPSLTADVVQDTGKVFELNVSECVWEVVFREAGLAGEIGHAAVCNMDYSWPPAFNSGFRMERTKTLMQGHDCCNHRYINTSAL